MEDRYIIGSTPSPGMPASTATTIRPSDVVKALSPEEDDIDHQKSLQIDMRVVMGDAVGNMSISPNNRDVVLASRKGLYIIDLEAPLNLPRFLPQGGTWDVADVQWNPHLSHNQYIISTSSEKLLIWNLYLDERPRTYIQHVLRSHYRAITDINWHTIEPDVVISTGIDSWQWAWDLRTVQKPIMGLCAFGPAGTQVKWNRVDGNILASSHSNEVLIWDRRKGSLPIKRIQAHRAKIYGIDWAHDRRDELVTCSLDKTIKIWDTQSAQTNIEIHTSYPVWRARDLPFGRGILSLPQRGDTTLEMYSHDDPKEPIEKFEGHSDVVKEFVWRRGGEKEFQLITWSKDQTLRFWPIDTEIIQQKEGTTPTRTTTMAPSRRNSKSSFSNPPVGNVPPPPLSVPIGYRGILGEVRAPPPHRPVIPAPHDLTLRKRNVDMMRDDKPVNLHRSRPMFVPATATSVKDSGNLGTMSRGPFAGGRSVQISTFQWLTHVKVGGPRDGSSGPGSGGDSGNASRIGSQSRPPSVVVDRSVSQAFSRTRRRSVSRDRTEDSADLAPTLQEEITSVVGRLNSPKLKLEKADFGNKKRTCTFGLQGPWGESTTVFLRITFTFPRDYPQAVYPDGIPTVDLERSPLISMKQRAFILHRLRELREKQRPCLEKCLMFLLFGDQLQDSGRHAALDSESSSEDESKGAPISAVLKGDKNLAEPRTSQGVFGVNGQLVYFSTAPPRIVRNPFHEMSVSPSIASRARDAGSRLFQSPALLSDAVKRLSVAAQDRETHSVDRKVGDDGKNANNVPRIMDNIFTLSQVGRYHPFPSRRFSDISRQIDDNFALMTSSLRSVYIRKTEGVLGIPDAEAAARYTLAGRDLADVCKTNAGVARVLGRSDHERVFRMLQILAGKKPGEHTGLAYDGVTPLLTALVTRLYEDLLAEKDIQMLVFLSVIMLKSFLPELERSRPQRDMLSVSASASPSPGAPMPSRKISLEYFDSRRASQHPHNSSISPPTMSNPPTPGHTPGGHAVSFNTPSSKGSWSSLFNASSMRQLVSGVKTNTGTTPEHAKQGTPVAGDRRVTLKRDSVRQLSNSPIAKSSWETADSLISPISPLISKRPSTFSQVLAGRSTISEKRQIAFHASVDIHSTPPFLSSRMRVQLVSHVLAYAEMLLMWQLPEKRAELLKLVEDDIVVLSKDEVVSDETLYSAEIGHHRRCERCGEPGHDGNALCQECRGRLPPLRCSICRLSVNGLYHACSNCLHITHMKCWRARKDSACASGCGCVCALSTYQPFEEGIVVASPIMPVSV